MSVLLALALSACREAPRKVEASAAPQPVAVQVAQVAEVDWPSIYEAVGTVRARTSTTLASKVMGYVREVKVHAGDTVSAGQLLVLLEARDLDAAYRQAEAAREEATGAAVEADHAVASAQANLDLAKVTFTRMADLYEKKSVSNQEYDEANARLKMAQATRDMAASRRTQVSSRIQQAQEAVSSATVMRGYSEIRAPFAGTITEKTADLGMLASPGAPLLTVEQAGAMRLEVAVEEGFIGGIRLGQQVTVQLDAIDQQIAARVSEIVPVVDPSARAFTVKIDLPSSQHLRSGMYGKALFERGARRVTAAPAAAIAEQGQVQTVLVVEEGAARTRIVTTGEKQGELVEILSGLNPGERVVSPRTAALRDGSRVEARE